MDLTDIVVVGRHIPNVVRATPQVVSVLSSDERSSVRVMGASRSSTRNFRAAFSTSSLLACKGSIPDTLMK